MEGEHSSYHGSYFRQETAAPAQVPSGGHPYPPYPQHYHPQQQHLPNSHYQQHHNPLVGKMKPPQHGGGRKVPPRERKDSSSGPAAAPVSLPIPPVPKAPTAKELRISSDATNLRCQVCFSVNARSCQGCFSIAYCSREHQIAHWDIHESSCRPLVLCSIETALSNLSLPISERNPNKHLGFYRAAKALSPKDFVLDIQPIMHVAHNKGLPVPPDSILCLGCNKWYQNSQGYRCTKCKWPVCSQMCELDSCHSKYECKVFTEHKVFPPQAASNYNGDAVLALRCLMLKNVKPDDWQQLVALEPVLEHVVRPKHLSDLDDKIAKFLIFNCHVQETFGVTWEKVLKLLKVIDYCSIWLPERSAYLRDNQLSFVSAKYVFPKKFLIKEDCAPNCNWSLRQSPIPQECSIRLKAAVPIAEDEFLTASFSDFSSFGATFSKRYENCRFVYKCDCRRCVDPTEGGSFFSGIKCPTCNNAQGIGYLLPKDPSDHNSKWHCHNPGCNATASGSDIMKDVDQIHQEILNNANSLQGLLSIIKANEGVKLHRNHFLIMKATQLSIDLCYGVCKNTSLHIISTGLLEKAKVLAVKLAKIYHFIYPTYSRENAKLLFHIQMLYGIARVRELYWLFQENQEKRPKEDAHYWPNDFWDILAVQKTAVEILMQEPAGSIERENAIQMQEVLEDTEALLITEKRNGRIEQGTVLSLHKVYSRYCSGYLYSRLPVFEDKVLNEFVLFKGPFCKDLVDTSKFINNDNI